MPWDKSEIGVDYGGLDEETIKTKTKVKERSLHSNGALKEAVQSVCLGQSGTAVASSCSEATTKSAWKSTGRSARSGQPAVSAYTQKRCARSATASGHWCNEHLDDVKPSGDDEENDMEKPEPVELARTTEKRLQQLSGELCPLLDRLGRALTDISSHLHAFATPSTSPENTTSRATTTTRVDAPMPPSMFGPGAIPSSVIHSVPSSQQQQHDMLTGIPLPSLLRRRCAATTHHI